MLKIKEIYIRIVGIPAMGVLLSFVFCPTPPPLPLMIIKSIIFVFVFWQGLFLILSYFRKKYSSIRETNKRLFNTILYSSIYLIASDSVLRLIFDYFLPEYMFSISHILWHWAKNFMISGMVVLIYESFYFYYRWHEANMETEQLKTQQIFTQLEVLKNQISPHFLFNSLNTLVTLISENQQQAIEFTQKLSEVYRHILQHKDKELVRLSTELEFIQSYVYLLKMRFSENLVVRYAIDEVHQSNYVAPLTLQMLVENAIKHNVISKTHPLHIEIYTENGTSLVVKNNLLLKNAQQSSTKTGLENIRKRYYYLSNQSIDIITTPHHFLVSVPLISLIKEQ
jgi:two-component system LytT family sensor kinase